MKKDYSDYLSGKKKFIGNVLENNVKLSFSAKQGKISVQANKQGLLSLAKLLIDFAYDDITYGKTLHLYANPSPEYFMEVLDSNSKDVIIDKVEDMT